jgi:serine/threonine-protein kinase
VATAGTPTTLGGYVLEEEIGSGASSVVYRARHERLGRLAAVKVLAMPPSGAWRERFLRESQLAASIDHPNVLPVYDAGEDRGRMFIAMRYVEGTDLRELLAAEPKLSLARVTRIVGQVAAALDAAHARGLVHRDVKPANILLEVGDHVYLSDFGVAKDAAALSLTRTGGFVGSVEYSAPEQIEGRDVDGRSDLYALGCVAYECLAGKPPFHRASEVGVLHAHLHDPTPDVRDERDDISESVADVLKQAMARAPAQRFETGTEFAHTLDRAARSGRRRVQVARHRLALLGGLVLVAALAGAALGYGLHGAKTRTTVDTLVQTVSVVRTVEVADAHALGDAAYAHLQSHDYTGALSYAERAYSALRDEPASDPYHGYINYDLGLALTRLGRCPQALPYLRRAAKLEPKAKRVQTALKLAEKC